MPEGHAHPCGFRVHRCRDRGWGEIAFEYRWDSTSGLRADDGVGVPDLERCRLYELTTYSGDTGRFEAGHFVLPDPPFVGWRFRNPTDGRTGPVGYECFVATQGWAWDRHKLGGRLILPQCERTYTIVATQRYRFCCDVCGIDQQVSGPEGGPHTVVRTFAPQREDADGAPMPTRSCWRYTLRKHGRSAWMDLDADGFVADSAGMDFGPWHHDAE